MTGVIKFYVSDRGYGFIIPDNNTSELFFHVANFKDKEEKPSKGDRVAFDVTETKKGLAAINISLK